MVYTIRGSVLTDHLQNGSENPFDRTAVRLRACLTSTSSSPPRTSPEDAVDAADGLWVGCTAWRRAFSCSDVTYLRHRLTSPLYVNIDSGLWTFYTHARAHRWDTHIGVQYLPEHHCLVLLHGGRICRMSYCVLCTTNHQPPPPRTTTVVIVEMWLLRRMMHIVSTDKVPNAEVFQRANTSRNLLKAIVSGW